MKNTYHKIDTIYRRDPDNKFRTLLEGQWSRPEFGLLADCWWSCTEKIDGTNIRVHWDGEAVEFGGRTDNAQISAHLYSHLAGTLTPEALGRALGPTGGVTLYGEGYGARIQKGGGGYLPDRCGFILFDVGVEDVFFERPRVEEVGSSLSVPVVMEVFEGTLHDAVHLCKTGFSSLEGDRPAEGLVMRPRYELRDRLGRRIIAKLKCGDFET